MDKYFRRILKHDFFHFNTKKMFTLKRTDKSLLVIPFEKSLSSADWDRTPSTIVSKLCSKTSQLSESRTAEHFAISWS